MLRLWLFLVLLCTFCCFGGLCCFGVSVVFVVVVVMVVVVLCCCAFVFLFVFMIVVCFVSKLLLGRGVQQQLNWTPPCKKTSKK